MEGDIELIILMNSKRVVGKGYKEKHHKLSENKNSLFIISLIKKVVRLGKAVEKKEEVGSFYIRL